MLPHRRLDGGYGAPPLGRVSGNESGRERGAAQSPGDPRRQPQHTPPGPTAVAGAGRKGRRQGLWQRLLPSRPLDPSYPTDLEGSASPPPQAPADFDLASRSAGEGSDQWPSHRTHSGGLLSARSAPSLGKAA